MKNKIKALAQHLNCSKSEITESGYNDNIFFKHNSNEYIVVNDEEADELWEQSLDAYLEECIYPELSEDIVRYFDSESWKNDARYDGRGHALNSYDSTEEEETVNGETYYIYRRD